MRFGVAYWERFSRKKEQQGSCGTYIMWNQQGTERTFHEEKENCSHKIISIQRHKIVSCYEKWWENERGFHAERKNLVV